MHALRPDCIFRTPAVVDLALVVSVAHDVEVRQVMECRSSDSRSAAAAACGPRYVMARRAGKRFLLFEYSVSMSWPADVARPHQARGGHHLSVVMQLTAPLLIISSPATPVAPLLRKLGAFTIRRRHPI